MSASDAFGKAKNALAERNDLLAKLLLAAGVTQLARAEGIEPVVTGGTVVDFYSAETVDSVSAPPGWKPSLDADVVFL
jgi:hypothetical protein